MELACTMRFECDERNPGEEACQYNGGLLSVNVDQHRKSLSADGMNGPLEVSLGLQCKVNDHSGTYRGFLTSGYLSKLKSVC